MLIQDCPFCKPTYGKPENQWKLCIFSNGGYNCVRCGSRGSWYDFKQRLGDLPYANAIQQSGVGSTIRGGTGSSEYTPLNQDEVVSYIESLDQHPDIIEYLTGNKPGQRGLSLDVLKLYKVGVKIHRFPIDKANSNQPLEWESHKCIVFPWARPASSDDTHSTSKRSSTIYYDRIKLRSMKDKKLQRLLPTGGPYGLFGWHTIPMGKSD